MRERILLPGQSDLDESMTRAVLTARPEFPPRPVFVLEETREVASTDLWTDAFERVLFHPRPMAGSLDPRFGSWTWTVYVDDAGRQVAEPEMTWNPRLPASELWGLGGRPGDWFRAGGRQFIETALGLPRGEFDRRGVWPR